MNSLQKKVATAVATGSLLLQLAVPVFADTTIEISGNGSDSTNLSNVSVSNTTTVAQSNTADISNNVEAFADTGNNSVNDNTGGSASIETGDASVEVGISNDVNLNEAEVACCNGDLDVLISGNGSDSDNTVDVTYDMTTEVFQDNQAKIKNQVLADAFTGGNEANDNTGGDVSIQTGDADVQVAIANTANSNSARIGGNGGGGSVSARILGNGSGSTNLINLSVSKSQLVAQSNELKLSNKVHAEAGTGENEANDNTGGDVSIETGDASVEVGIDNLANFNFADLDCGCLLDVLAKIAGNGSDSDNTINAAIDAQREVFQDNTWICGKKHHPGDSFWPEWRKGKKDCNKVFADAFSGGNEANDNTGDPEGDPSIVTGDADTEVLIENAGNVNAVGVDGPDLLLEFPEFPGFSFNLNLSLSLEELLEWLMGLV